MSIELDDVSSGYNISVINSNFQKLEDTLNQNLVWRAGNVAGETLMNRDLDMNGNSILNADIDGSSLTNDRALRVPSGEPVLEALPSADNRKGKVLSFDINTGLPVVIAPASGSAVDVLNQLALPTGAGLIGYGETTVAGVLDGMGTVVTSTGNLRQALLDAQDGEVVKVIGDVTLSAQTILNKAVSIDCSQGRIIWPNTGNAIRYLPTVKSTITTPIALTRGSTTTTLPTGHGVVVGDCLTLLSSEVRRVDAADGNYTKGQIIFVESVVGDTITFSPAAIESLTSYTMEVKNSLRNMKFDFKLECTAPTGTPGGIILDIQGARDLQGFFKINGNRDQNVLLGLSGYSMDVEAHVSGATNGASTFASLGYGISISGSNINVRGSGRLCRHVFEVASRTVVSSNIAFDMEVVKTDENPQFLYAAGVHANCVGWRARGSVSGSGYLIGDRSGTGDISMSFHGRDDGYDYADIYITDIYPRTTKIHNCKSYGDTARRTFVDFDIAGGTSNNGILHIDNCEFVGPKRILRMRDTLSSSTRVYRATISNCSGEAYAFTNRDLTNGAVFLNIHNNKLSSYGILATAFPDYMLGFDTSNCISYDLEYHNNYVDDTRTNGVININGGTSTLSINASHSRNTTLPFLNLVPTAVGQLRVMSLDHIDTAGQLTLNVPTTGTVYNNAGQVSFCSIRIDASNPIISTQWPVVYTGNSFKTTFDATLFSTKRPQAGNVNLSGKALNWSTAGNIGI